MIMMKRINMIRTHKMNLFVNSVRNFATVSKSLKSIKPQENKLSSVEFFKQENPEVLLARKDLYLSLDVKGYETYDYNKIYVQLMKLLALKPSEFLDDFLSVFLEKHVSMFSVEQMMTLFTEMGRNNIGTIQCFNAFQYHLEKKIYSNKSEFLKKEENYKHTQLFFTYFSVISELSLMEIGPLNFLLEYFSDYSSILVGNELDASAIPNLCNFMWFTSISIASILEKRKMQQDSKDFNTNEQVLNEKGARGLVKILNYLDKLFALEQVKNFSEDTHAKVRLYKSLYYLKMDGIELPKNLDNFLTSFKPFFLLNVETSITNSQLENTFENILQTLNVPYEKEKKLNFCSVDFFVKPHICIEVNGPQHYVFKTKLLVARDFLKIRTLSLENYELLPIHFEDVLDSKKLLVSLNKRLKHIGELEEAYKEVNMLKDPEYLKSKEIEFAGEKVAKRIKNAQYLV